MSSSGVLGQVTPGTPTTPGTNRAYFRPCRFRPCCPFGRLPPLASPAGRPAPGNWADCPIWKEVGYGD